MKKYNINREVKDYEKYLLSTRELFNSSSKIVYQGRNIIKNIEIDNRLWSIKSFSKPKNINKIIYSFFRDSKAKRSFKYSLKISEFVPKPLGYIEYYSNNILYKHTIMSPTTISPYIYFICYLFYKVHTFTSYSIM